jgi:hypothetical protein
MRDGIDMWDSAEKTYLPTISEATTVNEEITSELFSLEKVQQYPDAEFSLNYEPKKGQTWPQIIIKPEDEEKKRLVRIITRNNLTPSRKVLEYFLHENGNISLPDNPTDSRNQSEFSNKVRGLRSSFEAAKKKGILSSENKQRYKSF